jgi:hypothetical protein
MLSLSGTSAVSKSDVWRMEEQKDLLPATKDQSGNE